MTQEVLLIWYDTRRTDREFFTFYADGTYTFSTWKDPHRERSAWRIIDGDLYFCHPYNTGFYQFEGPQGLAIARELEAEMTVRSLVQHG